MVLGEANARGECSFVVKVNCWDEEMEKFQFIGELDLVDGIAAQLNNNGDVKQ